MLQRPRILSAFPLNCLWLPDMEGMERERETGLAQNTCRVREDKTTRFVNDNGYLFLLPFISTPVKDALSHWAHARIQLF